MLLLSSRYSTLLPSSRLHSGQAGQRSNIWQCHHHQAIYITRVSKVHHQWESFTVPLSWSQSGIPLVFYHCAMSHLFLSFLHRKSSFSPTVKDFKSQSPAIANFCIRCLRGNDCPFCLLCQRACKKGTPAMIHVVKMFFAIPKVWILTVSVCMLQRQSSGTGWGRVNTKGPT